MAESNKMKDMPVNKLMIQMGIPMILSMAFKLGTPLEEADIINRFEIRLRNERAYYAVRDLLTYYDAEQTAFSIINQYVRFVDEEPDKRKNEWKLNDRWAWFIGENRQSLKLTTKPEPYTLYRTLRWVQKTKTQDVNLWKLDTRIKFALRNISKSITESM